MPASADSTLLDRYASQGDASAFDMFMRRHLDFVYSAALRQTAGDSHRAQDVTQKVFLTAARRARHLARHALITGWLHRTTHHIAAELRRAETRRRNHESAQAAEAAVLAANPLPEPTVCWESLGPLLDAALDSLGDKDRETILLRYFAQKPFADIGATLGLTEAAAQMRAARAVEKLRRALAKRGVTSTASALGLALGANAVIAAPASVATSTLAALASSSAVVTTATMATGAGFTLFTTMTTSTKVFLIAAASLAFVGGVGLGRYTSLSRQQTPLASPSSTPSSQRATASFSTSPTTDPELIRQLAALQETLAKRDDTIAKMRLEATVQQSFLRSYIAEADERRREAGAKFKSVFRDLNEAGLFVASLNLRARRLLADYSPPPSPDSSAYADYKQRIDELTRDSAVFAQDPLLLGELTSGDPARLTNAQMSYLSPSLGLDATQSASISAILGEAYAEGFAQKLETAARPSGDASQWEASRTALNTRTTTRILALLKPDQQTTFRQLRYDALVFQLQIGSSY